MRLLQLSDTGGVSQTQFIGDQPPYAILSHTWLADWEEVTFRDVIEGTGKSKAGLKKVLECGRQAAKDGLQYFWVDTCSIDKSSSAELSEAINSMFQWYKNASICYVYLEDLPSGSVINRELPRCRWFTRGWTLQELLAPGKVIFFDVDWNPIGTKIDLVNIIHGSTGIPISLLTGHTPLSEESVATKMSWAARRRTTRIEDTAYCLLGIFGVNMPLIYGEGLQAFRRLQEEIVKHDHDLTIFAWDVPHSLQHRFVGLLAPSPAAFISSSSIRPFYNDFGNFAITNRGLLMGGDLPLRAVNVNTESGLLETIYVIFLGADMDHVTKESETNTDGGIYIRKVGPKLFCRDGLLPLAGFRVDVDQVGIYQVSEIGYILLDPEPTVAVAYSDFRHLALHVPFHSTFRLEDAIPERLWDRTDRIFLRPKRYDWAMYPNVLVMTFSVHLNETPIPLLVLCDYRERIPILKAFSARQYPRELSVLVQERYIEDSISWDELLLHAPSLEALNETATLRIGPDRYHISVSLQKRMVECIIGVVDVLSLTFSVAQTHLPLLDLS